MRAILATICLDLVAADRLLAAWLLGRMRCAAPASSITSMALSGRWRSLMYLRRQLGRRLQRRRRCSCTLWCSSKRDFRPLRISIVCSTDGLVHVDLLEAARQRVVLLEDAAVLVVGGRADALAACR
jgi:hypothetical protein